MALPGATFTSDLPSKSAPAKRLRHSKRRMSRAAKLRQRAADSKSLAVQLESMRCSPLSAPKTCFLSKLLGELDLLAFSFSFLTSKMSELWRARRLCLRQHCPHEDGRLDDDQIEAITARFAKLRLIAETSHEAKRLEEIKPKKSHFRFLDLPREIRDICYSYALSNRYRPQSYRWVNDKEVDAPIKLILSKSPSFPACAARISTSSFALLSTSHQILEEGLPIFIRLNYFYLRGPTLATNMFSFGSLLHQNLQHLSIYSPRGSNFRHGVINPMILMSKLPRIKKAYIGWIPRDKTGRFMASELSERPSSSESPSLKICDHIDGASEDYQQFTAHFRQSSYSIFHLRISAEFGTIKEEDESLPDFQESSACIACQIIAKIKFAILCKSSKKPSLTSKSPDTTACRPIHMHLSRPSTELLTSDQLLDSRCALPPLLPETKSARMAINSQRNFRRQGLTLSALTSEEICSISCP